MGGFVPNFAGDGSGSGSLPMGGSNQYMNFPTMSQPTSQYSALPASQMRRPTGGQGPIVVPNPTAPPPAGGPGTVPSSPSLPYGSNGYPTTASQAGGFGLQGGASSVPTQDPYYSQLYGSMLSNMLGSGVSPYNLQAYLPSSGGYTGAGQVAAPLTGQLGQLQQFLMGGQGTGAGQGTLSNLANTGYGAQQQLFNLAQSGGLTGNLGQLASQGDIAGGPLAGLSQTGGLTGILNNLYQTGGLTGPLGNLYQTGGLTGQMGNLAQTGGLTGQMGNLAQTGAPVDQTQAWQAMIAAEQQNIQQNEANLKEQFGSMGDLSSSSAANAMSQYLQQTALGQNASLTQATATALENAANRSLTAGQTGIGTELSAGQTGIGTQLGAGQFGVGTQLNTGQFGVGTQLSAEQQMLNNILSGSGLGIGTQLTAGQAGLGQQASASDLLTQMGGNLGEFTQGLDTQSIQALMNEYFATTPQQNPMNQEMFGLATTYPGVYTKQGNIGQAVIGSAGGILSGIGDLIGSIPT
jgi:hypothetical protein